MQAVKEEEWDRLNKLENSKVQVLVYVGLITYVRSTILLMGEGFMGGVYTPPLYDLF